VEAEMSRNTFAVPLALLLGCGAAQAAGWVSLGKSYDGTQEAFVDTGSITFDGGMRHGWIKLLPLPHTQRGDGPAANKWVDHSRARFGFDCNANTATLEWFVFAFDDGTEIEEPRANYPKPPSVIEHGTNLSAAKQFICAWQSTGAAQVEAPRSFTLSCRTQYAGIPGFVPPRTDVFQIVIDNIKKTATVSEKTVMANISDLQISFYFDGAKKDQVHAYQIDRTSGEIVVTHTGKVTLQDVGRCTKVDTEHRAF
jgi:hypothetical protein